MLSVNTLHKRMITLRLSMWAHQIPQLELTSLPNPKIIVGKLLLSIRLWVRQLTSNNNRQWMANRHRTVSPANIKLSFLHQKHTIHWKYRQPNNKGHTSKQHWLELVLVLMQVEVGTPLILEWVPQPQVVQRKRMWHQSRNNSLSHWAINLAVLVLLLE